MKMSKFNTYQYKIMIEAIEKVQSNYYVGDKMYNEYEEILTELRTKTMTAMDWE